MDTRMREHDRVYRTCVTSVFPSMAKVKYVVLQSRHPLSNNPENIYSEPTRTQSLVLDAQDLFMAKRFMMSIANNV